MSQPLGPANERLLGVYSFYDGYDSLLHCLTISSSSYLDVDGVVGKSEGGVQGEKKMARADPQTTTNDYDEFNDKDDDYDNGQRIR